VHDAPAAGNIQEVNITVIGVDLVPVQGAIIHASTTPKTFNLLDYTPTNPLELVNAPIPSGRYSQLRLILNADNTIKVDNVVQPLKTPSAQQSGIKLTGNFEITQGLLYTMSIHFDPNKSIVYNPGPNRYILTPVIEIVGNSLVDGIFTVSGLIVGEKVVTQLAPDGTLKLISTVDPRIEMHGKYYFNFGTRNLHLDLSEVICTTCANVGPIPGSIFYNLPGSDITVDSWNATSINGSVGQAPLSQSVSFSTTPTFALDTSTGYTVLAITVSYPAGYDGKYGVLSLIPQSVAGRTFVDIQQIQSSTAIFNLKIPYSQLPGGIPNGSKIFVVTPIVSSNLTDLNISVKSSGSVCGNISLAATNYTLNVPVADKVLASNFAFLPIP